MTAAVREDNGHVPAAIDGDSPHEALFAKMPQIATARVERAAVVIAEIARRNDPEASDKAQSAGFRTAKAVLAVQVVDELALVTTRQVEGVDEHVPWIEPFSIASVIAARAGIAGPTGIVIEHKAPRLRRRLRLPEIERAVGVIIGSSDGGANSQSNDVVWRGSLSVGEHAVTAVHYATSWRRA